MANFILTVGISGSGKTHFAHCYKWQTEPNCLVLDSDELRYELFGDERDQTHNTILFEEMEKRTLAALSQGRSVVYCATNLSCKRRARLVGRLKKIYTSLHCVCVVMNTQVSLCRERNFSRARQVPDEVITRQLKQFQMPLPWEGWDDIQIVRGEERYNANFESLLQKLIEDVGRLKNQNNHHHSLSLHAHMLRTARLVQESHNADGPVDDVYLAALWHDVGKPYTEVISDDGESHYYNHAEVGAYYVLNLLEDLHIAQLICYHMVPYKSEKEQQVWAERCGPTLWNEIMLIHKADAAAH